MLHTTSISTSSKIILALAVFTLACGNLFYRLHSNKIEEWDEARRGVAALEMLHSGNYVVNTYLGAPDYWSVKPPLGLWLMTASYSVFGPSRFALRFPAALTALLTVALVGVISSRTGGWLAGLTSSTILATTYPYLFDHSARAGEYDAPLALLIATVAAVLQSRMPPKYQSITAGILFALVFLLKSFTVIIPIGILLAWYLPIRHECEWKRSHWFLLIITFLTPVIAWATARYSYDGWTFLLQMVRSDGMERALIGVEGHSKGMGYYFVRVLSQLPEWCVVGLLSAVVLRNFRSWNLLRKYRLILSWAAIPLTIASLLQTKISWYINPSYPALAALVGILAARAGERYPRTIMAVFLLALMTAECRIAKRILERDEIPIAEIRAYKMATSKLKNSELSQSQRFVIAVETSRFSN